MGKLRDRMEADMKLKNFRPGTQAEYLRHARGLAAHFMRSPAELSEEEVRTYVLGLVEERGWSPSTQKVCVAALKFLYVVTLDKPGVVRTLYFPKVPEKLPDILSGTEVEALFGAIWAPKYRAIVMTAYGAGLRISEACGLGVGDIDSKRMVIQVRNGKGRRGRIVMLSHRLLTVLREYWRVVRPAGPYLFPGRLPSIPIHPTSRTRSRGAASSSRSRRTSSATRSPRTCWSRGRTSGRSRCSWATARSGRPSATPR